MGKVYVTFSSQVTPKMVSRISTLRMKKKGSPMRKMTMKRAMEMEMQKG